MTKGLLKYCEFEVLNSTTERRNLLGFSFTELSLHNQSTSVSEKKVINFEMADIVKAKLDNKEIPVVIELREAAKNHKVIS